MTENGASGGFAERLGVRAEEADDGSARIAFEARDEHLDPAGMLHGGVLAALVDTAMGTAVRTATGDDDVPATSQLTVTYLPGKPGRRGDSWGGWSYRGCGGPDRGNAQRVRAQRGPGRPTSFGSVTPVRTGLPLRPFPGGTRYR